MLVIITNQLQEGVGLLKKPDFEMRGGGAYKSFIEVKVP